MDTTYLIIAIILLLVGIIGVIIPIIPGIPLMFVIALIYGLVNQFQTLTTANLIILAAFALISILVDYLSGLFGARYGGANKRSLLLGFIGLIAGTIFFPPFGGILGLFLGVFLGEILTHKDQQKAVKAATGSLIGNLAGIIINLILAITFIILFIIFALR